MSIPLCSHLTDESTQPDLSIPRPLSDNPKMGLTEEIISLLSSPGTNSIDLHTIFSTPSSTTTTKPALLCLHFWGGSNRTFLPLISERSKTNDTAILAPSLRGWRESSKPADPEAYHIAHFVDNIVRLLAHLRAHKPELLQNGFVLVGHSMGGKIAQVLPTRPEVAEFVRGVVLIAPAPCGSFRLPEEMREVQVKAYESERRAREVRSATCFLGRLALSATRRWTSSSQMHWQVLSKRKPLGLRTGWVRTLRRR